MITKTEHRKRSYSITGPSKYDEKKHIEDHLITTYWFLFIPIYRYKELVSTNL
jgi:hypothetical protein